MTSLPIPFKPRRFQTAATWYLSGRPPYPGELIARVAGLCGLDPAGRLMDLGCGPGQLAIGFSPYAGEVVAVDPEPEMLGIASASAGAEGIKFVHGSSYDLPGDFGVFRAVTIGRAFHWMDRVDTLRRLDGMIESGGAVVLFDETWPDVPENSWRKEFQKTIERWAQGDEDRVQRKSADWTPHETVLLNSAFRCLERVSVIKTHRTPVSGLTDRALSLSSTSPGRLGDRANQMVEEIREAMKGFASQDSVTEVIESRALIARREFP